MRLLGDDGSNEHPEIVTVVGRTRYPVIVVFPYNLDTVTFAPLTADIQLCFNGNARIRLTLGRDTCIDDGGLVLSEDIVYQKSPPSTDRSRTVEPSARDGHPEGMFLPTSNEHGRRIDGTDVRSPHPIGPIAVHGDSSIPSILPRTNGILTISNNPLSAVIGTPPQ